MWLIQGVKGCAEDNFCASTMNIDLTGNKLWCPTASSIKGELNH
jgi:hypothetical protein